MFERVRLQLENRYAVEYEVGRGGMAVVYYARDLRHDREVAIKVLDPDLSMSVSGKRFLREIEIASALSHPHILPLLDSGAEDRLLYYVMPYVAEGTLRDRLNREEQLPVEDAIQIAREVADALSYAHSRNIVHRDIKPANIVFSGGHALLADFGIARAIEVGAGEELTRTGVAIGTTTYMSPEQASGKTKIDGRSDIYSLGCVLYEMLGGEVPHTGATPQAVLARKLTEEARPLHVIRTSVTVELDSVIHRALAPTPADRFATAHDFSEALTHPTMLKLPSERRRTFFRVTAALAAAAALLFGWFRFREPAMTVLDDSRIGIAVFPFRVAGAPAARWSEQLADLLSIALEGTPGVRVADPWTLWQPLRPERSARAVSPVDPAEATGIARRSAATRFVLGTVSEENGVVSLRGRLYRAGLEDPLFSFAVSAPEDSVQFIVHRAAVDIMTRIFPRDSLPDVPPLDRYATRSPDALKTYLHAKEAMRRGLVDEADAAIDSALTYDSTFALGLVEATRIKTWTTFMRGRPFNLMGLAERAVRHSDSLSEKNRLRAQAMLASVRTDGIRAVESVRRILELDSTDFGAWSNLAYYHNVYGWQYGRGTEAAVRAAERAVQLDSNYIPGLVARAWLAPFSADDDDVARQVARLERSDTTNLLVRSALLGLRSLSVPDAEFEKLAGEVSRSSVREWIAVLRYLRSIRPERAELLLARLREVAEPGFPTYAAESEQARLWIAQGHLDRVDSLIKEGGYQVYALYNQLERLMVAATLSGVGDSAIAAGAVRDLEAYVPIDSALAYYDTKPVWWTGWLIAAYHATLGDTMVAKEWRRVIGTLPPGGTSRDYRGSLQADIDARLAGRRGDLAEAMDRTAQAYDLWTIHTENTTEGLPEPMMRFQLGMLLRQAGMPDSAAQILKSLTAPTTYLGFLTARASYELGEIALDAGRREEAAQRFADALRYWRNGGPAVRDWAKQAEEGLRRSVGERGE